MDNLIIRPLAATGSIDAITELLHRAYKALADAGFRYVATWQDAAITRKRFANGRGFVAELDGAIVATVTLQLPDHIGGTPWYERPDVACIGQFGVEPALQRRGIGTRMMDHVEQVATEMGIEEAAVDTAEHAAHLIAWYERRGYRFIEHVQWPPTNYRSVVLSKTLRVEANQPGNTFSTTP